MAEFTGERVIPGQVDVDLWNEHVARYVFASRLARRKRVVDMGCGAGYGSAELAKEALSVVGIDVALEAVEHARANYSAPNLTYLNASCAATPFAGGSFDLAICYEVIEHIPAWRETLEEARRLLKPGGQFIVSTPNKSFYAEARAASGPNPYHDHEFEFEEFRQELERIFPSVLFFLQNHSAGIVFQPLEPDESADVTVAGQGPSPAESHFFIAVCAMRPQMGAPTFVYLPAAANLLREREQHIRKLEEELATKTKWLDEARAEHQKLVIVHRELNAEVQRKNKWAEELNREIDGCRKSVETLNAELVAKEKAFEAELARVNTEAADYATWAQENERKLMAQSEAVAADLKARCEELAKCVEVLHTTEAQLEERTAWGNKLNEEVLSLRAAVEAYQTQIQMARGSRWLRLGRTLGIGPELKER